MTTFKSYEGHVLIFESKSLFHPSNTQLGVLEHSLPANDQMLVFFFPFWEHDGIVFAIHEIARSNQTFLELWEHR